MTSLYKWIYLQFLYGVIVVIFCLGTAPSCDKSEEKEEANSKISSLPVISSVRIMPEKPLSSSHLQAVVEHQGLAPVSYVSCWKENGEEITGEEENSLESENFSKGDSIEVEVTP